MHGMMGVRFPGRETRLADEVAFHHKVVRQIDGPPAGVIELPGRRPAPEIPGLGPRFIRLEQVPLRQLEFPALIQRKAFTICCCHTLDALNLWHGRDARTMRSCFRLRSYCSSMAPQARGVIINSSTSSLTRPVLRLDQ